jgi:hypothetical protein
MRNWRDHVAKVGAKRHVIEHGEKILLNTIIFCSQVQLQVRVKQVASLKFATAAAAQVPWSVSIAGFLVVFQRREVVKRLFATPAADVPSQALVNCSDVALQVASRVKGLVFALTTGIHGAAKLQNKRL